MSFFLEENIHKINLVVRKLGRDACWDPLVRINFERLCIGANCQHHRISCFLALSQLVEMLDIIGDDDVASRWVKMEIRFVGVKASLWLK